MSTTIDSCVSKLAQQHVDAAAIEAVHSDVRDCMAKIPVFSRISNKREVDVTYRGVPVNMTVQTVHEETNMKIFAKVKAWAVEQNLLAAAGPENDLVPKFSKSDLGSVDKDLLTRADAARKALNSLINDGATTSDVIAKILEDRY